MSTAWLLWQLKARPAGGTAQTLMYTRSGVSLTTGFGSNGATPEAHPTQRTLSSSSRVAAAGWNPCRYSQCIAASPVVSTTDGSDELVTVDDLTPVDEQDITSSTTATVHSACLVRMNLGPSTPTDGSMPHILHVLMLR